MDIRRTVSEMQALSRQWRRQGLTVGFVPTMGCLHAGHLALVDVARERCDRVVVSIFVNPTQFGPGEDFATYPRVLEADRQACREAGAAALFFPTTAEMYAPDHSTWVTEEMLSVPLCGRARPGHFRGVATVVLKLFMATLPDVAVFGRKDAQQALVIRRMVRDLNVPVEIVMAPTVREADGLALSSRNKYLSPRERVAATALARGLFRARDAWADGERRAAVLVDLVKQEIAPSGGRIEYVECTDGETLAPIRGAADGTTLIAVAARYGETRLIDNVLLD